MLQFRWTPCGSDDLHFLSPEWIRSGPEIRTWQLVVSIVCFNLVHMHHVDRVMRQLKQINRYLGSSEHQRIPDDHRSRFLSQDELLKDPRVQALSADIRPKPSLPRPDISLPPDASVRRCHRGGRAGGTGGAVRRTRNNQGEASTS
ncbi:hypothetical protein PIB30_098933 [Stylosanthes scabra]|uniref:Uncharacterized protein n=1 Tax=Stylosanthes scabra TaxID=79078 RepID=A0ABU6WV53_9FABA|nr:hypothetical protein [Stylosanthes scabra]